MQIVESHKVVDLYIVPACESFMAPNLDTPSYHDSLAQSNLA